MKASKNKIMVEVNLKKYKLSQFNTAINIDSHTLLLYNSLYQSLSVLENDEIELYNMIANKIVNSPDKLGVKILDELIINNFVVPIDIDETNRFEKNYFAERNKKENMVLTVLPTLNCNFNCVYCFEGQNKPSQIMPELIQESIFNLIKNNKEIKHLNITWFGGEPLIGSKVMTELANTVIPYCDLNGITYNSMLITNGYLLSKEVATECYLRRIKNVQITLDGQEEEHDSKRQLKGSGKKTYQKIIENIKNYIHEIPIHTTIRVNVDLKNMNSIKRLIQDLADEGLGGTGRLALYFAPIEASTSACSKIADSTLDISNFAKLEFELYKFAISKGLANLSLPYKLIGICGALRPNGHVILPNGEVHKCWETVSYSERKTGLLNANHEIDFEPELDKWNSWSPLNYKECSACNILPNCAGICAYRFLYNEERADQRNIPCPSMKYNIKERLLHYVASNDPDIARKLLMQ